MELGISWLVIFAVTTASASGHVYNAVETEMFAIQISPNLFNWTFQVYDDQYRFSAALLGKPELPIWLQNIYSQRHNSGFIFGTPPPGTKTPLTLQVIGLNRYDYETRRVQLILHIHPKENMARHEVELKIDNLNVEDLLDEHRMTSLKDILRTKLWPESNQDLYPTFLASAIEMGARLPLKPSDGEGLVVRFGSSMPFSIELKRLREEVRPLSRLPSCPRDYKRTTVERLFRDAGLSLDWCSFKLYNTFYKGSNIEHLEYLTEVQETSKSAKSYKGCSSYDIWSAPSRRDLPSRSYTKQLTTAVALPLALLLLAVACLTAVLCFHYAAMRDPESEWFLKNIFHICIDYKRRRVHKSGKVELCRYGTSNTEQTQVPDNNSNKSLGESPYNSLARPSPKPTTNLAGSYNRPQPPPYIGSANNTLHHRKSTNTDKSHTPSTSTHTPEHRGHLALEESLKLLNEANISNEFENLNVPILKDQIVDLTDGDYVPIKGDVVFVSTKADLDDIDVPELGEYGLGGVVGSI